MDSMLNPLDDVDPEGCVVMPVNVTTVMAEELRARLVLAADHYEAVIIDASETENIGQAALQLLIAARREAERLDLPFAIQGMGPALLERLARLGVADILGLSSMEGSSA